MKPPRVSIAGLMVLVGFVAANFAAARALDRADLLDAEVFWIAFAPFESILLFALLRLAHAKGPRRAFWGGFLALGSMALVSIVCSFIDRRAGYWATRLWGGYDALVTDGYYWVICRRMRLPYGEDGIT